MRYLILSILDKGLLSSRLSLNFCGTELPAAYDEHLRTKDRSYLYENSRAAKVYVPTQYHITGTDSGDNYFPLYKLIEVHCQLNARMASADLVFFMASPPKYINSTKYYNDNTNAIGTELKNRYNVPNVCNVCITNSAAGNCEYATFPGFGAQGIIVKNTCNEPGSTTLVHEMGHFLGLPHTFSGWEGRDPFTAAATNRDEFVDGTNCSRAGDYFCDTPADFISDRWNCPYTGPKLDFNGDLYNTVLDGTYYMSYSNDACQNKFSPQQRTEMYNTRITDRASFNTIPVPSLANSSTVTLVSPNSGSIDYSTSPYLRWTKSDSATHYQVMLSTSASFSFNVAVDVLTTDTFFAVNGLNTSTTYYWKVKPVTMGNLCGAFSSTSSFRTSSFTSITNITNVTCPNGDDGAIYVEPSGGTEPYSFQWSNGMNYNPVSVLTGGFYTVTITDLRGKKLISEIPVSQPAPINLIVYPTSPGSINALASGGNGDFTYAWSDGVTTSGNSPAIGNISVTATDKLGCQKSLSLFYNGLETHSDESIRAINLYPNPLQSHEEIIITFNSDKSQQVRFEVIQLDGKTVLSGRWDVKSGINNSKIQTEKMSNGMHVLRILSEDQLIQQKFSILR